MSVGVADVREWLIVYLKGVCMGAADAVPGVSGGTIALIAGIYERLIGALTAITPDRIRRVVYGVRPGRHGNALDAVFEMDGVFLAVLGAGIVTAVVTVTRLLDVAIDEIPVLTFGFFFGLIAASAVVLYSEVTLDTPGRIAAALAGFALAFVVSGRAATSLGTGPAVIFVAGAIAVSAMILPGISGSLLLIILGQYEYMVETLKSFVDGLIGVLGDGTVDAAVAPGLTVVVFVGGAVVGLFTVSHVVRRALERRREATMAFLVSLIAGALRAPVAKTGEKLAEAGRSWAPEVVATFLAVALVGAALVVLLDRYAGITDEDVSPEAGPTPESRLDD
jgi:putative membrane protein